MNLSEKHGLRWLSGLIRDIREVAPDRDPLMVGAMARDVLLFYGHGVPVRRATTDVDLAFAVEDWRAFAATRDALVESGLFVATRAAHRLCHRGTLNIDLIPFGGVEDAAGRIVWPDEQTQMQVVGYREACATALDVLLPEDQRVSTVSLPMLAAIKLVAWVDRHRLQPRKDASDLLLILGHYLNKENATRLYDEAAHLLAADEFDYEAAGAWLAGHDVTAGIRAAGADSTRLLDVLRDALIAETDPRGQLRLIGQSGVEPDTAMSLLCAFQDGLSL